jgi:hypothetical protein
MSDVLVLPVAVFVWEMVFLNACVPRDGDDFSTVPEIAFEQLDEPLFDPLWVPLFVCVLSQRRSGLD